MDFHKTKFIHWWSMENVAHGTIDSEDPREQTWSREREASLLGSLNMHSVCKSAQLLPKKKKGMYLL